MDVSIFQGGAIMVINHNLSAIFANRQLQNNDSNMGRDIAKLSSGFRINSGADDASGLAVSEKMRTQVSGLSMAMRNTSDGISFIQASEGYLEETTSNLQRVRELLVQASNGVYSDSDRALINVELSQLVDELNRVAKDAEFNGMKVLTGRFASPTEEASTAAGVENAGAWFHVGANMDQRVQIYIGNMDAKSLGLVGEDSQRIVSASNMASANRSIGLVDQALEKVVKQRTDLGAYQNRFEKMYKGLSIAYENTVAAESRIRDVDMAEQMSSFVKNQILSQSSASMLAQANLKPQLVLRLLG
jgi:flagellin